MYTIPAFGPWPEQNAGPDEEKRLNSAQQSKTSPTSIDREHETGVFYGSGKLPYQTSLAACTCNDFVNGKSPASISIALLWSLGSSLWTIRRAGAAANGTKHRSALRTALPLWNSFPRLHKSTSRIYCNYTSERVDDRQRAVTCYDLDVSEELRTSPLIHENPYPLAEQLSKLSKPALVMILDAIHRDDKPRRSAAKAKIVEWIAENVPMLANELPPCASFSFVEVFDKAQRDVYKYLRRKYDTETDWYTGFEYPAGAGLPNENELVFYFPEDRVTAEGQAGAVCKGGNPPPRGAKISFIN